MSDGEDTSDATEEKKFFADHAKTGRSSCRHCKQKINSGALRLAKSGYNPFGPGPMKMWHHVSCLFEVFAKQRATTARIDSPDDIAGWSNLNEDDQEEVLKKLGPCAKATPSKKPPKAPSATSTPKPRPKAGKELSKGVPGHKDNAFREFRRLCAEIAAEASYTGKTAIVRQLFTKGTDGDGFKGDLALWVRLLLPGVFKRVYNLQSKQLVKLFSKIFKQEQNSMLEHLENGDVADTICTFFERSRSCQPSKKSLLSMHDVDKYLEELSELTKEEEQIHLFTQIAKKCTSNDLKMIIRLVKHDLRINCGPKHILEAIHADAYQAFQTSRDINAVLAQAVTKEDAGVSSPTKKGSLTISATLMTPVLPMLAEACKSVEMAMKKCPNGMYSEIKYDGERVQVHKQGSEFKYFSRSLKPVMPHKVNHFKEFIPEAFPHGRDLILDSEVLMIDTKTSKPLPFGTLGVHKKGEYKDANVCLFVFDCIYYNGEVLLNKPVKERRKILLQNMKEIPNRILFSEMEEVHEPKDLENMITKVFKLGLEGLVLKDLEGLYEPGKRHWLKVKKDYLFGGAMADSADLVVLGAWFGTGQKGGMMSVFLMGCRDSVRDCWCTVTKVHTGHDDKTLERLQKELQMVKISKEASRVPNWLKCTKTMIPDFVAKSPKDMPVWEITGAEFTQHDVHTADGISIRFPRVTRIRSDKTWETATTLSELKDLYKNSKDSLDFTFEPSSTKASDVTQSTNITSKKDKVIQSKIPPKTEVSAITKAKISKYKVKEATEKTYSLMRMEEEVGASSSGVEELEESSRTDEEEVMHPKKRREQSPSSDEEEYTLKKAKMDDSHQKRSVSGTPPHKVISDPLDAAARNKQNYPERYSTSSAIVDEDSHSIQDTSPLPDVFKGVSLLLPPDIAPDRHLLLRYFITFGGKLLEASDGHLSTHILHKTNYIRDIDPKWPTTARHVHSSWLTDSIKLQAQQKTELYAVYLETIKG